MLASLYGRISAIFLVLLLVLSLAQLLVGVQSARNFSRESDQSLNRRLAADLAGTFQPELREGLNVDAMARHIHDLMVFNPRVEIYLLDAEGRVLVNLIDNALRYTPREGQVRVELASGADSVKVLVVDTGQGIPPEDLPHVFDRFYRADKSRSRISGGSGIGLAIAKHILASHRSDIHVERSSASGTVFAFELPTRHSRASAAAS